MNYLLIITALLSVSITALFFYLLAKRFFENEQKRRMLDMRIDERKETLRTISPLRLQAYERMVLFLERISPSSLVMRCYKPNMDAQQLRATMADSIRNEWEHNLSQQVYMSSACWEHIREAKDQMLNLLNTSAATLPDNQDPTQLAGVIFTAATQNNVPTDAAIEFLKDEIRKYWD